jgi:hypothetical protein
MGFTPPKGMTAQKTTSAMTVVMAPAKTPIIISLKLLNWHLFHY